MKQTEHHQRACSYTFQNYADADHAARELAILGAEGVKLTCLSEKYRVKFKAAWSIEQQIVGVIPKDAGPFRTDSPSSKEELSLISEMYCCWNDAVEMESTFRRSRSALASMLESEGMLIAYPNRGFVYNWEDLFAAWEGGFSPENGFSEALVEVLQVVGVLDDSARQLVQGERYFYVPVKALSPSETENLYSLLCEAGEWNRGKQLALSLGDHANAARWLRRESIDQNPVKFFRMVANTEGLPMEMLYQRELARAYWAWSLINGYSKVVAQWADAAKTRVADYYAMDRVGVPHVLEHPDLTCQSSIVRALGAIGDEPSLKRLANESNRLAAAILADMHRVQMKRSDYPLDAADHWAAIQDGYWPTESEVHDALADCICYDHQYAKKMEHVGFMYWGFRNKSYTAQW